MKHEHSKHKNNWTYFYRPILAVGLIFGPIFSDAASNPACVQDLSIEKGDTAISRAIAKLDAIGLPYSLIPLDERVVIRLEKRFSTPDRWRRAAQSIFKVYGLSLDFDETIGFATFFANEDRIAIAPFAATAGPRTLLWLLHHETVHARSSMGFIKDPWGRGSGWISGFTDMSGLNDSLPAGYESYFRIDELKAFYKSVLYLRQAARLLGDSECDELREAIAGQLNYAQDSLTKFLRISQALSGRLNAALDNHMVTKTPLRLVGLDLAWASRSSRHALQRVKFDDANGSFVVELPYLLPQATAVGGLVKIDEGQLRLRILHLSRLINEFAEAMRRVQVVALGG